MKVRITVVLFAILLLFSLSAYAHDFLYQQLSITEGFPPSIQKVYAESNGYVWIGSKKGLGQFNGYTLKTYTHLPDDSTSLPGNEILQIIEDSSRQIWVLTHKGLARYDRHSDTFHTIKEKNENNLLATAACKIRDGILFISRSAVWKYDYSTRKIAMYLPFKQKLENFFIHEIWEWDKNHLLCVNKWNGIFLLNLQTGEKDFPPITSHKEINQVFIDSKQRVWTSIYNKGITCYGKTGKEIASYTTENSSLSHNIILCFSEHKGEIWTGTDGGGINIINPEDHSIKNLIHTSGDRNSLPVNSIVCLYQGYDNDNCWAGSVKGGLIHIRPTFMHTYGDAPLNVPSGLSEKAILSFYQEPDSEKIWIGTDGGGVNLFDPVRKQFKHFPETWGEKIASITRYSSTELLVSIFSKGLFTFNKKTGKLTKINEGNPLIQQYALYGRKAVNLYQNSPQSILILSSKIYKYNPSTRSVYPLIDNLQRQAIPFKSDSCHTYLYDEKHIYAISQETDQIQTVYTAKTTTTIRSASKDIYGNFWIGSNQELSCYDPLKKTETPVHSPWLKDISTVICDNNGRVWIGTNHKLLVWHIKDKKLISFDESDGAAQNEFLDKAVMISRQGDIYMGGVNGLLCINQSQYTQEAASVPTFSLTDILCDNQSMLSSVDFKHKTLSLSSYNKNVSIQVMTHEENICRKKTFRWYISGSNSQIIENNTPEITLYSLTPDTYQIAVSCDTKDGEWTSPQTLITLYIPPAWYQSWWFITLCIIAALGIGAFIIINLLQRKEERMASAIKEHKQKVYEEKVRFLININHELRTPLTLIHTPLSSLLQTLPENSPIYPTIHNVLKQSRRMKDLLNMVLNLRKMEMTEHTMNLGSYMLNEWVKEVGKDFSYEEEKQNISLKYEMDHRITKVDFDKEKHLIILTNLIVNAFKHSNPNSTIILRTELIDEGKSVRISVIDQGCGLNNVDLNKLFTRFYQGKNEKEGSGIGLSYAKILVEQHHGQIGACNNKDQGACFFYELPVHQHQSAAQEPSHEYLNDLIKSGEEDETYIPLENQIDISNYSCLYVDDNEELRNFISSALSGHFKHFYLASNGEEALQIALNEIPDIVISDIMMPKMNGYELCRRIKENVNINHILVILLTARVDEESRMDGYRTGADTYLEKPFDIEKLLVTVSSRLLLREQIRKRYMFAPSTIEEPKAVCSSDDTFLFKLNKIIVENIDNEALNITFICREMGTSRASLYNRIKTLTNIGPNEYINKLKMETAMTMLRDNELSITEIAEKTGFSSSRYFSTAFKKFTGKTPSQYKEEISSQEKDAAAENPAE